VFDLSCDDPIIARPDVLLAGSPCQGFSTSGKRLVNDPRNELLVRAGNIAIALQPRVFILENVPAVLSGIQGKYWQRVENMLRWNGYNVRRIVAEGIESGIAQLRRRIFMIAWKGSDCTQLQLSQRPRLTLQDALQNVELVTDHFPMPLNAKSKEAKIARAIKPGQKLSNVRGSESSVHTWNIPEVFGKVSKQEAKVLNTLIILRRRDRRRNFGDADPVRPSILKKHLGWDPTAQINSLIRKGYLRRMGAYVDLVHTYNGKFRRLRWDAPSPTVDTHFGDPVLFLHPSEDRGFSSREAARIQGFSDSFTFSASPRAQFRMIGNAVPPPMAARIAEFVRRELI
jgi:DNA (cytosine-5)-methyltransferase 1